MLCILDLRLIGYSKIKQGILQQNISKYYRCESTDVLSEQFKKFINTLKRETKNMYPWIDQGDKRRNMSEREILDK